MNIKECPNCRGNIIVCHNPIKLMYSNTEIYCAVFCEDCGYNGYIVYRPVEYIERN